MTVFFSRLKPIFTLMFLSPFLAEVLSGSFPITAFITAPVLFLLFLTVGYGFPVLVIRELYIRKNVSFLGLFILGVGYGLINEGLFAQTIFFPFHSPIASFGTYGLIDNIRIPFALTISVWHAFFAVVFPIILAHSLFPQQRDIPWLSTKTAWILGVLSIIFGCLGFFTNLHPSEFAEMPGSFTGNVHHFIFLAVSLISLFILGLMNKKKMPREIASTKGRLCFYGVLIFLTTIPLPTVLAGLKVPVILFLGYFLFFFIGIIYYTSFLSRIPAQSQTVVALAGEVALSIFGALLGFFILGNLFQGVFLLLLMTLFIYRIYKIPA